MLSFLRRHANGASVLTRAVAGLAVTATATVGSVLLLAAPASAHVTVNPSNATQGGYTKLTFRVPNEKDATATTKLEVTLPADSPLASVSIKPMNGWTVQADKTKLATPIKNDDGEITEAVTKITWTAAADNAIKPGQFQEFDISVGPLPEKDQLVFKALQTYSDGEIVRWIDEPQAGTEAEHPAPVLKLARKADSTAATGAATGVAVPAGEKSNEAATGGDDDQTLPISLGVAGLVAGLAGLAFGLLAWRRVSRTP
jgi:uncharacterized protein YcnI